MIEFAYLIHKPTDMVISYNKWLEFLDNDEVELFVRKPKIANYTTINCEYEEFKYKYNSRDMIFNNDFKIIYKHDLNFNELREINNILMMQSAYSNPLTSKIGKIIDDIYKNEIRCYINEE